MKEGEKGEGSKRERERERERERDERRGKKGVDGQERGTGKSKDTTRELRMECITRITVQCWLITT